MKIAISADGPSLHAKVGQKLGTSPYLIVFNLRSRKHEAVPVEGAAGQRGAGLSILMLAVRKEVKAIITGYCNPSMKDQFKENGIDALTGVSGAVEEAIERYEMGELDLETYADTDACPEKIKINNIALANALRASAKQFFNLLPVLAGVILFIGLFNALVSKGDLSSVFTGNKYLDTLWGACFGSILAGNPINSYVIGDEFLDNGVSLYAVTALIVTWVTVGLMHLPVEVAALGKKFAILRNILSFILSIPVAITAVFIVNLMRE